MSFNKRGDKEKNIFTIQGTPLENVKSYKYLGITISNKNCSLLGTLTNLSVKANRALFSLKTNLNLMKMPIKLLLKIFDTMIVPILLYGAEVWIPSGKFTPEKWDKTTIEKQHTSLLEQILGLNRSIQNNWVRAEFGRLPLLVNTHARVWNYIKYLKVLMTSFLTYEFFYLIWKLFERETQRYQIYLTLITHSHFINHCLPEIVTS